MLDISSAYGYFQTNMYALTVLIWLLFSGVRDLAFWLRFVFYEF